MTKTQFNQMNSALQSAMRRYPNCRIANCNCNTRSVRYAEWKAGCYCGCHFFQMDAKHGKDKWTLAQFNRQAREGLNV